MAVFKKWRSIDKFSDAYTTAQKFGVKEASFRAKIKLHGTNAGIQFEGDSMIGQKRTSFVTVDNDNAGFARYLSTLEVEDYPANGDIIYGEWAGPGVQKNDAVSFIPKKSFFVFALGKTGSDSIVVEPDLIDAYITQVFGSDYNSKNIYVLPWHTKTFSIDFQDSVTCQTFIDAIMKEVDENIAVGDPYIKEQFGVEGEGEGLVVYMTDAKTLNREEVASENLPSYMFKAKTEAHTVQKSKKRGYVVPEKPEGVEDFIQTFFTEGRFEQMLTEIGGVADRKKTGDFMKAVMSDVHKESKNELEAADFEWKDVPKYAAPVVKTWWFKKCETLE